MMRNYGGLMEIYEIWCNDPSNADMHMEHKPPIKVYTFVSKRKAIKKMQRCNKDCNWGKPYFIKIVKTDD